MSSSSNIFWKNFINLCFPKPSSLASSSSSSSSAAVAFTHSLDHHTTRPDHNQALKTATQNNNSDPQLMMIKTFNAVYDQTTTTATATTSTSKSTTTATDDFLFTSSSDDSDNFADIQPDLCLASVFASQRFFFSSPGHSKSLIHSSPSTPPPDTRSCKSGPLRHSAGGVPVRKYSPDPYSDFRSSMQEMIEARDSTEDPEQNWEYLHELLTCYLSLNPKHTHDCIIKAFSDLVVDFVFSKHNADSDRTPADVCCPRSGMAKRRPSVSRRLL